MSGSPVYLDYHATTPVDRRVLDAMLPYFTEHFGNPSSSSHSWGWKAQEAVEKARKQVAGLVGATAREVVFTSGATESNNFAIRGVADARPGGRRHVAVSAIEHKSVLEAAERLEAIGWRVTRLPVGPDGIVDLEEARAAITPETALVSVMAANNEIGVIQPLAAIGAMAHAAGALFHVDAAQAVGRVPVDVAAMDIDLMSMTGHKMYGPKGCGALYVKKRTELAPLLSGGGQERGRRAGTLNVAERLSGMRDRLLDGLRAGLTGVTVNGSRDHRLPNNLHVGFAGVDGAALLIGVGDIAVSVGSACDSGSEASSHVLEALGGEAATRASIRFGLGRFTTDDEIDYAIEKFVTVVRHLQRKSQAV
jgi:cysteine desulfurase